MAWEGVWDDGMGAGVTEWVRDDGDGRRFPPLRE